MSHVRLGLLIATIVFAVFAAYAFLAPTTYRTSALLVVDSATPGAPATLPEPLEAARRLSEGILDRATLEQLSRDRAASTDPGARARAATAVRESLSIDTSDAHSFSLNYKDSERERTQRVCNQLTHYAAVRAPLVLLNHPGPSPAQLKRQQQTQDLASFLALHPQVAAESPVTTGSSPDKDPALSAFHAEKTNLERRVAELEAGAGSDNPYADPAEGDVKQLKRRLTEINTALTARREALEAKPSAPQVSPEVRAEWKRLLDAVAASNDLPAEVAPALVARVVTEAPLPGWPIDPNRPLLLLFGVVFGSGLGAAYTLVARAAQQRRTKSSRPPQPAQAHAGNVTVKMPAAPGVPADLVKAAGAPSAPAQVVAHVPAAPALPSNLGPPVAPVPQLPAANVGPAIVPIPQKQISSNPPPPGALAIAPVKPAEPQVLKSEIVKRPPSDPPAAPLRFASTLVLPPSENPTPNEDNTPDPVLASAARAWDDQIRAHEVPGFAVVRPRSEPPPGKSVSSVPPPVAAPVEVSVPAEARRGVSSAPPPAATIQRTISRPPNQMKVTQPLGSFLPDGVWNDPSAGLVRSRTPQNVHPPRSPVPPQPPQQQEASGSTYSYVSKAPPPDNTTTALAKATNNVTIVRPVPAGWRVPAGLAPESRRPICEQLYPLALERSLALLVVGVPEASEQKSRTAVELALELAASGHPRVLLMEADLQNPRVHRLIGVDMPMGAGFSQQLRGRINGGSERRWTVVGCSGSLHVLAEGMMRTPGLLLSTQFAEGLRDLRSYYDFIVIDGPTASLQVESQALDAVTNAVVIVGGKTPTPALGQLDAMFRGERFKTMIPS